jgi:hypothetical protein
MKHIDILYHFVRVLLEKELIRLKYCPTEDMVADILTKGLPRDAHEKHTKTSPTVSGLPFSMELHRNVEDVEWMGLFPAACKKARRTRNLVSTLV